MGLQIQIDKMRKFDRDESKVKGACSVVLADGRIKINNVTIVEGKNGLFVSLPQRKGKDDKYYNIVSIRDDDDLQAIKDAVMAAFEGGEKARPKAEPVKEASDDF